MGVKEVDGSWRLVNCLDLPWSMLSKLRPALVVEHNIFDPLHMPCNRNVPHPSSHHMEVWRWWKGWG